MVKVEIGMAWSWQNIDWPLTSTTTAAWVQAIGAIGAVYAAYRFARADADRSTAELGAAREREDRERRAQAEVRRAGIDAYMVGARAAVDHAVEMLEWLEITCGGMRNVNRMHLTITGAIGNLKGAEHTVAGMPLHLAPSAATARALVVVLEHLRLARQTIESFLDSSAEGLQADFGIHVAKTKDASAELTREHMRLSPDPAPVAEA